MASVPGTCPGRHPVLRPVGTDAAGPAGGPLRAPSGESPLPRPSLRTGRGRGWLVVAFLLPWGGAAAQVSPPAGLPRAGSSVSLVAKHSRLAGASRLQGGGWGGVVLGQRLLIGGGGLAAWGWKELSSSAGGRGFETTAGYGGLVLRFHEPLGSRGLLEFGALAGAGNARVRDRYTRVELGADNFLVWEPEVGISLRLPAGLRGGVAVGYRMAWKVEDLPTLGAGDFRGMTLAAFLARGGW